MKPTKTYLALGDSMSIDRYTGVVGGGAVAQFYRALCQQNGAAWTLDDRTRDGNTMSGVDFRRWPADLVTITIGGNDLLLNMTQDLDEYVPEFTGAYNDLMGRLRRAHPEAVIVAGNIYRPAMKLGPAMLGGLDAVNAFIRHTLPQYGIRLADIHGAFLGHEDEYLCFAIEPTLQGAKVIADLFEAEYLAATARSIA